MKLIKNIIPPKESTPFNPAKSVEVPADGSNEIKMNGMGGESFGVNRILPYAPNMDKIMVSARLNEDLYIFRDIQLSVVHQLFKTIDGLLAPFIIQRNNDLIFELENKSTSAQDVNIELIGYDHYYLSKLKHAYNNIGAKMPMPRFLYGQTTVGAGKLNKDLGVKSKSVDVEARRMAVTSDQAGDITVSLKVYNTTVRNEVYVEQLNDEFHRSYANVPFIVGSKVPFNVRATNKGMADAEVSFLCECYVTDNSQVSGG